MQEEYSVFVDSISFDTTYRSNKDYRPLPLFVGYNHQRDMVIFGAALLFDERSTTFQWLFEMFDKCMGVKEPTSIFKDQAATIAAGTRAIYPMPVIYHGLCTFHILNNAARNLGSLCEKVQI
ncbi:Protein FAR1-RELATED SEQUENCE 5 [Linum perenne]